MTSHINYYQEMGVNSEVFDASPHRLIAIVFDALVENINAAKASIERNDVVGKCKHITKSVDIVMHLRATLNHQEGGEIAQQLDDLYDFIERNLVAANVESNTHKLEESKKIVIEIKTAWDQIGDEANQAKG